MVRRLVALAVFAGGVSAAPLPKSLRAVPALHGAWEITAAQSDGTPYPSGVGTKWTLEKDGTAVRDRVTQGRSTATFTFDPTADPKTFDWHTAEGHTFLGVYELAGDRFRVCLRLESGGRPGTLADTTDTYLFEFKRLPGK
jgi:uncharacterized protein (TIGR03067 family)